MSKVIDIKEEVILFDDGSKLYSEHDQDCCEMHELDLSDISVEDFEGLEFDLSKDGFFRRIEDYGVELIPIKGWSVRIAGHGYNNGYYSHELTLVLEHEGQRREYDITECQDITE